MFEIKQNGANRVDIEFSGKLDSNEMKAVLDELARQTRGIEKGRMLYRIGDFKLPILEAVTVELSRFPQLFSLVKRFDRAAVVADKRLVRKFAELEGKVLPGFEIKAFEWSEEDQAEAWLAE